MYDFILIWKSSIIECEWQKATVFARTKTSKLSFTSIEQQDIREQIEGLMIRVEIEMVSNANSKGRAS